MYIHTFLLCSASLSRAGLCWPPCHCSTRPYLGINANRWHFMAHLLLRNQQTIPFGRLTELEFAGAYPEKRRLQLNRFRHPKIYIVRTACWPSGPCCLRHYGQARSHNHFVSERTLFLWIWHHQDFCCSQNQQFNIRGSTCCLHSFLSSTVEVDTKCSHLNSHICYTFAQELVSP